MIPYDDLVIALQTWRAKQGLPVLALSGQFATPPSQAQAQGYARPQEAFLGNVSTPPPLDAPPSEESLDVDGANLIEEHYDADAVAESADYAENFNANDESTSIGNLDDVPGGTEVASPAGRGRGRGGQDW